ncbi:MAG: RNA polymerase sigma factor [Cytophagales bacterium]|nr:RNA polymerase sigma factor [Cytophagales bacterium]
MDDEYIDQVLSGDTHAFRYFLQTYKDMAFNLAVSIVKDDHHAEEVVQDAFMKAFNGLRSFNRKAQFKSWFYRIVVNESFQFLKKLKRNVITTDVENVDPSLYEPGEPELPAIMDKVRQAMMLLPPKESMILNLYYLEEHSMKEIRFVTGWSTTNAKVILHRARKHLRALLNLDQNI